MEYDEISRKPLFYFDLSSGNLYTDEEEINKVVSCESPRNLQQLYTLGRLLVATNVVIDTTNSGDSSSAIKPLAEVLQDDKYEIEPGTCQPLDVDGWSAEKDYLDYGSWLSAIASKDGQPYLRRNTVLYRAYSIGLGPSPRRITSPQRFGTISRFYKDIGMLKHSGRTLYDSWNLQDFVGYIQNIANETNRKPTKQVLRTKSYGGEGPSPLIMSRHSGYTFNELLEFAGFPNIESWQENDYITWGVRYMLANEGSLPTYRRIDLLSRNQKGPSAKNVADKFSFINHYHKLVKEAYESKLEGVDRGVETRQLPASLFEDEPTDYERIRRAAQYTVLEYLGLRMEEWHKKVIARVLNSNNFVSTIKQHTKAVTEDHVKTVASRLGVYDDIWTLETAMENLKIPQHNRP